MRVLQVYRDHFLQLPGGIERHVYDLSRGLSNDYAVDMLCAGRRRRTRIIREGGVRAIMAAEWGRIQGVPFCPTFPRTIRRGSYDVVHVHSPNPTGELGLLAARTDAARVATYHAESERAARFGLIYHRLLGRVLRSCDRILVSSQALAEVSPVVAQIAQETPEKLQVVPLGIDTDRFSPGPSATAQELRSQWGDRPVVLFVGRLRYYKGLPELIRAVGDMDVTLVVAGDGLEREQVVALGQKYLAERFVFLGDVEEDLLPDLYRAAEVFCLPSTSSAEAFGLAAVEAMASGVPVVTTEVGTATSIVNSHGETGIVVPPSDVPALREALEELLGDEERRRSFGQAGRRRAVETYSLPAMVRAVARIYEDILSPTKD